RGAERIKRNKRHKRDERYLLQWQQGSQQRQQSRRREKREKRRRLQVRREKRVNTFEPSGSTRDLMPPIPTRNALSITRIPYNCWSPQFCLRRVRTRWST